ncbi:hypothetical protein OCU04_004646 [Sclerotinia nivalis]|uniref:Uncharacterized protein n=1 Tax=Sclerotinia nivalis TaxID=352851 RepID=A0A9X0AU83_9HELO|nr:hypothetical protein OCU04_004646 [Sclerotinia nivalis]
MVNYKMNNPGPLASELHTVSQHEYWVAQKLETSDAKGATDMEQQDQYRSTTSAYGIYQSHTAGRSTSTVGTTYR